MRTLRKRVVFNGRDWGDGAFWQRRQLKQRDSDVTMHGEFQLRNLMALVERYVWERRGGQAGSCSVM